MFKRSFLILVILSLAISLCSSCNPIQENNEVVSNLNKYMAALEENTRFQGVALVEKDGKVLIHEAYGMSDANGKIKNSRDTTFLIGSVTKQFTAMAILQLQEKGLLNVYDKLSKYIPDYPRGSEITLYNLLTHTSGIAEIDLFVLKSKEIKLENVINSIKDKPMDSEPGEKWSYNNSGYILLGYIIEKVSNLSLEEYLKKYFFTPLEMTNTGVCYKNGKKMYAALGYSGYLEIEPVNDKDLMEMAFGAGYLYSTANDLLKWCKGILEERLVRKKTLEQIFNTCENTGDSNYYGFGWFVSQKDQSKEVYHGGNTPGFTSIISMDLERKQKIIILSNKGFLDVDSIKNNLKEIISGKNISLPTKRKEIKISSEKYDQYIGTYQFNINQNIVILKDGSNLFAQFIGQGRTAIYPESENKFFFKKIDAEITFYRDGKDEIQSLELLQNGKNTTALKIDDSTEAINAAKVDPAIYQKYVGDYGISQDFKMSITCQNNRIFAQVTGQQKIEIFPESETQYFYIVLGVKTTITFKFDDKDTLTGAVAAAAGHEYNLKKL